jgi:hypothetical protein
VRSVELASTVVAGALGAAIAAVMVGASLLVVLPAALGVVAVGFVADRTRRD